MVWTLVLVENGLGLVGNELHSPCHRHIVSGDEEKVKWS
jgi:hypothetical protein